MVIYSGFSHENYIVIFHSYVKLPEGIGLNFPDSLSTVASTCRVFRSFTVVHARRAEQLLPAIAASAIADFVATQ